MVAVLFTNYGNKENTKTENNYDRGRKNRIRHGFHFDFLG